MKKESLVDMVFGCLVVCERESVCDREREGERLVGCVCYFDRNLAREGTALARRANCAHSDLISRAVKVIFLRITPSRHGIQ